MERTKIEGTLPVATTLVAEQQPLKLKKVVMTQLRVLRVFKPKVSCWWVNIFRLKNWPPMTRLVDVEGNEHNNSMTHWVIHHVLI